MAWKLKSTISLVFYLFVSSSIAEGDKEIIDFPPFPRNEFLTYWEKIDGKAGDRNQLIFIIGSLLYESIYNENGAIYFTTRSRTAGAIAIEEIRRQSYSCKTQSIKILDRKFAAYTKGLSVEGDDMVKHTASVFFKNPHEHLKNALQGTCKLFNHLDQVANNMTVHALMQATHNLVLNNVVKDDDFPLSILMSKNIDFFKGYENTESMKPTFTKAFELTAIIKCEGNKKCWDDFSFLINNWLKMSCLEEEDMPLEFKSELCSRTKVVIEKNL